MTTKLPGPDARSPPHRAGQCECDTLVASHARSTRCRLNAGTRNTTDWSHENRDGRYANDLRCDAAEGEPLPEPVAMTAKHDCVRFGQCCHVEDSLCGLSFDHTLFDVDTVRDVDLLDDGGEHTLRARALLDRIAAVPLTGRVDDLQGVAGHEPLRTASGARNTRGGKVD